ncbi:hypothetical protein ABGT24_24080, partial [Peribacillus frigoritolerans]
TPNQQFHKEFMQNSEWPKNFAIFSTLTYRSFRDKFITGLIVIFRIFDSVQKLGRQGSYSFSKAGSLAT